MSRETDALKAYLKWCGLPHRVTAITGGNHVPKSRHFQGLAIDVAGPKPGRDTPELLAIFQALAKLGTTNLYELIYAGPEAKWNVKAGKRVNRYAVKNHHDHVHVAVDKGFTWCPPCDAPEKPAPAKKAAAKPAAPLYPRKVQPMFDPPIPLAAVWQDDEGRVLAGVAKDGAVYCFAVPYVGGMNVKPYSDDFVGREAARLGARDDGQPGYQITATSGEQYRLP